MTTDEQKYPIGKYQKPEEITAEDIRGFIADIAAFPKRLRDEISELTDIELDTPYRPDGWTVRQVVNHCADSHMNGFIRFKLALTEENPVIKPYYEARWAELPDSKTMPVEAALRMLEGLHERWTVLLERLSEKELSQTYIHPENQNERRLDETISVYAWHGNHHLAHITGLKGNKRWK